MRVALLCFQPPQLLPLVATSSSHRSLVLVLQTETRLFSRQPAKEKQGSLYMRGSCKVLINTKVFSIVESLFISDFY